MKKSLSLIALIAIIAMLFTACSPKSASTEDIAAAKTIATLVSAAMEEYGTYISDTENGLEMIKPYVAENGDTLTGFTMINTGNPDDENAILTTEQIAKATIAGKDYTLKLITSYNVSDPDSTYTYTATINEKTINPSELGIG